MRVLVTAGGTSERIDEVRSITNFSTGRLGSLIADEFIKQGFEVTYLCSQDAFQPSLPVAKLLEVASVQELLVVLQNALYEREYDVVIHSMAVSDYYLAGNATEEELLKSLRSHDSFEDALETAFIPLGEQVKKMSSAHESVYLQLKQTPKVISIIKQLQPQTSLVGFKLLVDVKEEELIDVAKRLMVKNDCDFVLANDLSQISGDVHPGHLIDQTGSYETFGTKQEIAEGIVKQIKKEKMVE